MFQNDYVLFVLTLYEKKESSFTPNIRILLNIFFIQKKACKPVIARPIRKKKLVEIERIIFKQCILNPLKLT